MKRSNTVWKFSWEFAWTSLHYSFFSSRGMFLRNLLVCPLECTNHGILIRLPFKVDLRIFFDSQNIVPKLSRNSHKNSVKNRFKIMLELTWNDLHNSLETLLRTTFELFWEIYSVGIRFEFSFKSFCNSAHKHHNCLFRTLEFL